MRARQYSYGVLTEQIALHICVYALLVLNAEIGC